jgi:glycine C-acetyltransferase
MNDTLTTRLRSDLAALREQGLYKGERVLEGPQGGLVRAGGREVINLCANNYLGLANHPAVREAAKEALDRYGYGMASVRFICGTDELHKSLEQRLARFLGTADVILYSSCFDANGGLFETLLDERDAVISDALNHASIIDGIRLCKAQRLRYANSNMAELEQCLKDSQGARTRLIATDGVFSMDGFIARLGEICDLAERYDALVMVDDSHATGFMGATGRGTPEHCGVAERIDILTGTLGKALGGGSGGYIAARGEVVEWLRQRSRPYLFSNSIPPVVAAASIAVLELLESTPGLRAQLFENARFFRDGLSKAGFELKPGEHPIIPVMLGDAALAARMAEALLDHGVYVIGFSFPVVPKGQARIRTQMSAALTRAELPRALAAFTQVGRELGIIG